jgi:hypothetical protein
LVFLYSSGIGRRLSRYGQPLRIQALGYAHERLERGLVAEEAVLVRLVGADHHLDRRVEVHPREV